MKLFCDWRRHKESVEQPNDIEHKFVLINSTELSPFLEATNNEFTLEFSVIFQDFY
jgi:hypothetical protein